ncbi:MAG: SurA N-terminal domain-containing protein [Gammaproteobacteria bacterium]
MISFLRERLQGIVAFSFLGIVALTFAFLGLPTFTQTFNNNDYAQIGKYSISQSEYFRTKSQVEQNLRSQFGDGLNFSDPAIIDIVSNLTNNSIIEKYTLINLVDDLDIKVPAKYIETELSKLESFQVDGKFSQDLFKNYLINFNLSKEDLVEDFESDLKLNLAVSLIDATSSSYDKTINQYLDLLTERRSVTFVELNTENVTKEIELTDEALQEYYSSNIEEFSIPESRSYLLLDLKKTNMDLGVSEEDVQQAYNLFLENLPTPEKRISHIMIIRDNYESDEAYQAKVSQVAVETKTVDFSKAVKALSDDLGTVDTNGDLGFTNGEVFPSEFEQVIRELKLGEISNPIEFESNTHFLKITELTGAENTTLEDKRAELVNELEQIKFEDKVAQVSSSITFSDYSVEEVYAYAQSNNLEIKDFEGMQIDSLPFSFDNAGVVIETDLNNWSSPLQIAVDNYSFAYVYAIAEKTYKEFESVKASVTEKLTAEMKSDYLNEVYASSEDLKLDKEFLKSAFEVDNFKVENFKGINRSTSLLSNDIVGKVFNNSDIGQIKKETTNNGLLIYVVEDRIKGDSSDVSEEDKLAILEESKRTNLQLAFNDLREKYGFDEKISISNQFANQNL